LALYCSFFEELSLFDRTVQQTLLQNETLLAKMLSIAKLGRFHVAALRFLMNMCHQSTYGQDYIASDHDFLHSLFSNMIELDLNESQFVCELAILSVGLLVNLVEDNEKTRSIVYPNMDSLIESYVHRSQHFSHDTDAADHHEMFMSYYALLLLIMYDPIKAKDDGLYRRSFFRHQSSSCASDSMALLMKRVQRCLWIQQQMSQLHQHYLSLSYACGDGPEPSTLSEAHCEFSSYSSLSENMRTRLVQNLRHLADGLFI
jgi:hypothetical protein